MLIVLLLAGIVTGLSATTVAVVLTEIGLFGAFVVYSFSGAAGMLAVAGLQVAAWRLAPPHGVQPPNVVAFALDRVPPGSA